MMKRFHGSHNIILIDKCTIQQKWLLLVVGWTHHGTHTAEDPKAARGWGNGADGGLGMADGGKEERRNGTIIVRIYTYVSYPVSLTYLEEPPRP